MKKTGILIALIFGITLSVQAQKSPKVKARQEVQQKRIKQGVASGELTRMETKQLVREQRVIARTKRKMKADGKLTKRERLALDRMQDKASRDIRRQKNDVQDRN